MEYSDQGAARQESETPMAESGKINPSFRNEDFEDALIKTGLKRSDIARLLGVAPSTVYRWGRHLPVPAVLIGFLRIYAAWATEETLLEEAVELLDGSGTRAQVARVLRKAIALRNTTEKVLSELP